MRCPVCQTHQCSPQDNNDILFNGMCSECLVNCDYYYREDRKPLISEQEYRDEGLSIVDFIDQDFVEPIVKKEIKNVRRRRKTNKTMEG
jgi:hypothetical protein